jgi:hypothetical protein
MMRILATDLSDAPDRRMTSRLDRPRRSSAATRSPSGVAVSAEAFAAAWEYLFPAATVERLGEQLRLSSAKGWQGMQSHS